METLERSRLSDLVRAPGSLDAVVGMCVELGAAQDKSTVVALLQQVSAMLGVDGAFFTSCFGDDETHKSYRSIVACDPRWESQYASNHWYLHDPWLHYAMSHTDPCRTEAIGVSNEAQRWVVEAATHFGFAGSMVAPVPAPPMRSRAGALVLGSARQDFFHDEAYPSLRVLARMIAVELGDWQLQAVRDELVRRARINGSDLELLRHEQKGHSTKVIAAMLGSEVNTINSRFHRLSLRLGATNRRTALRIAEIHDLL